MKRLGKIFSIIASPFVVCCVFLSGCILNIFNKTTSAFENNVSVTMQDNDKLPEFDPMYKAESEAVLECYNAVANNHMIDGEVDSENEEVVAAACEASAKLYAYACYNERYLDRYCYFLDQDGKTDLGGSGSANATKQEYFLRINESDATCGYRYFYTLKKVNQSSGMVGTFKGQFESARLRMSDKTNLLYRFEGDNIRYKDDGITLECDWSTGSDWGKPDLEMVKGEYIAPEDIEADVLENAEDSNRTIRGNINTLAPNIVKYATISMDDEGCYFIMMVIDTDVANTDEASLKMLRESNGSSDCKWTKYVDPEDPDATGFSEDTGLRLILRLWPNGLFRSYTIIERWTGGIVMFTGTAESTTTVEYSYTERDCDMTAKLEMLEAAKQARG